MSLSTNPPPRPLARAARTLCRLLAAFGLLVLLILVTPIDRWWAHAYAGSIDQPRGDVLILLSAANDDHAVMSYSSYWRARYALLAWRTGVYRTIVVTGGGGPGIQDFLLAEGVPAAAILAEWQSTTTRENALNTARLLQGVPGTRVLLTSDFHMYRALRVFRRAGLNVTPYAVPDVIKRSRRWDERFSGFTTLVTETVKILYYRARGWT